jgi:hypothetical protein
MAWWDKKIGFISTQQHNDANDNRQRERYEDKQGWNSHLFCLLLSPCRTKYKFWSKQLSNAYSPPVQRLNKIQYKQYKSRHMQPLSPKAWLNPTFRDHKRMKNSALASSTRLPPKIKWVCHPNYRNIKNGLQLVRKQRPSNVPLLYKASPASMHLWCNSCNRGDFLTDIVLL